MEDETFSTNNIDLAAELFALDVKLERFDVDGRGFIQFVFSGDRIKESLEKIAQNTPVGIQDIARATKYIRAIITGTRKREVWHGTTRT